MEERISILVVHHNRLDYLKGTIESIMANTIEPYELLIWDNASTEPETKEYLETLAQCKENYCKVFYSDKNIGVWQASNRLIAEANEPEELGFVKMDNDVVIKTRGWLGKWKECCKVNPDVGMVAVNIEGKKERSPDTDVLELNGHPLLSLTHEGTGGMVYVPGESFSRHGYYCEEYGIYGQGDKDYAKRVVLGGRKFVYHREVEVERFAVNNDDQTGGYRNHKNLYVRRNRKIYILNRHLYKRRLKSLAVWYEKYPCPDKVKANPCFTWASTKGKLRWESGRVTKEIKDQIEKHKLTKVKK